MMVSLSQVCVCAAPSEQAPVAYSAYSLEQAAAAAVQTTVKPYGDVAVSILDPQRFVCQPAYGTVQMLQSMAQQCLQELQQQQQQQHQQ